MAGIWARSMQPLAVAQLIARSQELTEEFLFGSMALNNVCCLTASDVITIIWDVPIRNAPFGLESLPSALVAPLLKSS
jgi:hypothetical protein